MKRGEVLFNASEGQAGAYCFNGGTGTGAEPVHFPVPVLVPIKRPDASRCILVAVPAVPLVTVLLVTVLLVTVLPVRRPEASRYWVWTMAPVPPLIRVSALPAGRPLASR